MPKTRKSRPNATGRSSFTPFMKLPRTVYNSDNFRKLSPSGLKLLIDIAIQYNGRNNGDLQASLEPMRHRGWVSSSTLNRAKRELEYYGFIELTRQGGLGCCSLYALTWESIDDCGGKTYVRPTRVASSLYKESKSRFRFRTIARRRTTKINC